MPSALFSALALSLLMPTPLSSAAGLANMYTPRVDGQPLHHVTMEMATERTGEVEFADTGIVPITLRTLGDTCILIGTQQLTMQSALLSMLVLRLAYSPQMMVRRDQLLRELWPDQEEVRQRGNLRQALYKLRGMGVRTAIRGDMVCLDEAQLQRTFALTPTVELFERDVTRGAEPYGLFLPGVTAPTPELREWLDQTREALHGDIRRVLADVLRARRERADWSGMHVVARWLLEIDPLNEDGTLGLAECVAMTGSKVEAVGILDRYLAEVGTSTGEIRLPASVLRKRFVEQPARRRSVALVTDKHFVGRDTERSELTMSLRRARWHDGSAVLVHGPPGIGKSRLMSEVLKVAQLEGYHDVVVESRESISIRPLGALIEAIPQLLSAPGAIGCAPESLVVLRKLIGHEGKADAEPEAPEADVLAAELSPAERIEHAMRTMRAQSIRHAVVDLFAAVSEERPIFLLAEDVHWLDNDSWEVLSDVIQRVNEMRVYIVLTGRFSTVKEERPARIPVPLTFRRLAPMAEGALQELIRQVADEHGVEVPPAVDTWIIGGCEGNPLMLRALLEHWVVTGQAVGVPPTLMALIDHRIDRLNGHAQQALQAIGLLNRFASLERVKLVLELPVHELIHAIEQLELSGCLSTSQSSLIITHDLVRQVGMRRMSPLVDAALRAAIGDTLEAEYGRTGDLEVLLESLVHTDLSGRPDVVLRFLLKHDAALVEAARPSTVIKAIDTIHKEIPKSKKERRILRLHINMESQNGSFGKALSLMPGGITLPSDPTSLTGEETDECLSFVEAAYRSSPMTDSMALATFASSVVLNTSASPHHRLRAADIGITIASNVCNIELANMCYLGLQLSEKELLESERTQKIALIYHTVFGSFEKALQLAEAILENSKDVRSTTKAIIEFNRAGYVFRIAGKPEKARASLMLGYDIAREIDAPRLAEYPIWQLSNLCLEENDLDAASVWSAKLDELARSNGDEPANDYIHSHLCLMAIAQGKNKEAGIQLARCQRALTGMRPLRTVAFTVALELGVGLMDRRWIPNPPLINAAMALFEKTSSFCASDFLAACIGESLVRLDRTSEAKTLLFDYTTKKRRELSATTAFLKTTLERVENASLSN
ncbi:ATP-binding protein [Gemmatimonas sp.]|uniref:ATP-binding protein n=1 Tax=Gemmatimonas sp. TaxID=1962908 RepID=UPI0037BE66E5